MGKARFDGESSFSEATRRKLTRQRGALGVGLKGNEEHLGELVDQLCGEDDFFVRETITWAVASFGERALPYLHEVLAGDADAETLVRVLHAVSKVREPSSGETVRGLLDHESTAVVDKAVWTLGVLRDVESLEALASRLETTNAELGDQLVKAVASIVDVAPGWAERGRVVRLLTSPQGVVRERAATILGEIAPLDEQCLLALVAASSDDVRDVRVAALVALAACDDPLAWGTIEAARVDAGPVVTEVIHELLVRRRTTPTSRDLLRRRHHEQRTTNP